jgi:predicted nucleic-acid-binding protein
MKVTADTNVLLRLVVGDDPAQRRTALQALESAESVAISRHALCELAWVLDRSYEVSRTHVAATIRKLLEIQNAVYETSFVEAGLANLDAGGDFAGGVIAYEGRWLGAATFISFDKKAVNRIARQGYPARLLS